MYYVFDKAEAAKAKCFRAGRVLEKDLLTRSWEVKRGVLEGLAGWRAGALAALRCNIVIPHCL